MRLLEVIRSALKKQLDALNEVVASHLAIENLLDSLDGHISSVINNWRPVWSKLAVGLPAAQEVAAEAHAFGEWAIPEDGDFHAVDVWNDDQPELEQDMPVDLNLHHVSQSNLSLRMN